MIKMNEYYTKRSQQRINVLREVLREYKVDFNDVNKIEMLMEQAKIEQKKNNPFLGVEKPMKILYLIIDIFNVIAFVGNESTFCNWKKRMGVSKDIKSDSRVTDICRCSDLMERKS